LALKYAKKTVSAGNVVKEETKEQINQSILVKIRIFTYTNTGSRSLLQSVGAWGSNCLTLLLIMPKLMVKQRLLTKS
jgi:hypothetical protein